MYDVIIIGAGVSGSAIARECSRFPLKIAVLEKCEDVCCGTSKANSAIIHAGYDAKEGTLMAKLNVEGNLMMDELAKDLDIPFQRIGSFVVCTDEENRDQLTTLYNRGITNGVPGLRIVERDELKEMEPNISDEAVAALYAPSAGIVCPFELNLAMAENAAENGVEFYFDSPVEAIQKVDDHYEIKTPNQTFHSKYVVNAAGVYADVIHNMVSADKMEIIPRKGEYYLLDKSAGKHVSHTIFQLPTKMGKGVLVTPTVHGNMLVGPTSMDIDNKEGVNTTRKGLDEVAMKSSIAVKNLPMRDVITSFAGLRAHHPNHEFIIEEVKDAPNFIDVAGIESPGLSSCPAIGVMVAKMIQKKTNAHEKTDFKKSRKGLIKPSQMSMEERNELIQKDPRYGTIICRCEMVTEGEIVEAVHRIIPARSLDGIKRRTRAGMGRCQAGFCSPRVMEVLSHEVPDIDMYKVSKSGGHSNFIVGNDKEDL